MPSSEPVYVRDCEKCGKPRTARASRLQASEGGSAFADTSLVSIRCGCGSGAANDRDIAALRERPLETAVEEFANSPHLVDRLKNAAFNQCHGLLRAGHANAGSSVQARVQALNKFAGREDERMEQFVAEACLAAEESWKRANVAGR
jgi:hypothetical protein